MNHLTRLLLILTFASASQSLLGASAQELGTNIGIPQNSPGVLWPRGMSIEALSPQNLYPNGPQFGLSNTSGGFGMTGSGPVSGVGLAQRSVSPLVQREFQSSSMFVNKLSVLETAESARSSSLLSSITSTQFRIEMNRASLLQSVENSRPIIQSYSLPTVDSVLGDRPASADSILKTGL
jgi:hypothetical protein